MPSQTATWPAYGIMRNFMFKFFWRSLNARPEPAEYRAPSWSWAAVDSPVSLGSTCNWLPPQTFATFLKADMDLVSNDHYGAIRHGALWIRCDILMTVCIDVFGAGHINIRGIALPVCVYLDHAEEPEIGVEYHLMVVYRAESSFCGLVLQRTRVCRGQYRRIGLSLTTEEKLLSNESQFQPNIQTVEQSNLILFKIFEMMTESQSNKLQCWSKSI